MRALARLSLPELVRGKVRGGTSSITQFMPVTDRTQVGKIVRQTPLAGKQAPQNAQVLVYLGVLKR